MIPSGYLLCIVRKKKVWEKKLQDIWENGTPTTEGILFEFLHLVNIHTSALHLEPKSVLPVYYSLGNYPQLNAKFILGCLLLQSEN
jgi:hypothetical protein